MEIWIGTTARFAPTIVSAPLAPLSRRVASGPKVGSGTPTNCGQVEFVVAGRPS